MSAAIQCHDLVGCASDRIDGLAGQGDAAHGSACCVVVDDLQLEGFEEASGDLVGHIGEFDRRDRQVVQQCRVRRCLVLVLKSGELFDHRFAVGPQFGAAFVEVADEALVDVLGEFEAPDESLALGLVVGDGSPDRRHPVDSFGRGRLVEVLEAGFEELATVWAE